MSVSFLELLGRVFFPLFRAVFFASNAWLIASGLWLVQVGGLTWNAACLPSSPLLSPASVRPFAIPLVPFACAAVVADEAVAGGTCNGGDHHHHHHDDHHEHGPADAGAYVTLAVDFLHNLIDGIG